MTKLEFYAVWAVSTCFGLFYRRKYSSEWNEELNRLIDEHWSTSHIHIHTIILGGYKIWIGRKYYSYGHLFAYPQSHKVERRPSLKTMFRLARLAEHLESQQCRA